MTIREKLFARQDTAYADFQSGLVPGISRDTFIGVRVPELRKLAKELSGSPEAEAFLRDLPHTYYEENMLHALLLCSLRDYDACLAAVEAFLPHVDNWAVCDILSPKVFRAHRSELLERIRVWAVSEEPYTCRFGIEMLMVHFLEEDFRPEYLEIPAAVRSDEYYVRMMIAWFFATALARQWDAAVKYVREKRLDPWTHSKTIQKARESFRITPEQKEYLSTLKIKKKTL